MKTAGQAPCLILTQSSPPPSPCSSFPPDWTFMLTIKSVTSRVTRHRDIRARNYGTTDKFRVDVWEEGASRGRGGRKDIAATLHATKPQAAERPPHVSLPWHPPSHVYSMQHGFPRTLSPWLFGLYILAGLVSMVILILPLHGDTRSLLHENLQVSVVQKLVAAYVLGLLTMVFLQG
ncbi:hypothetical protein XENTR_v10010419 [Xenopus tropicalis]|nr:hypothetical protein XENTR_v10010419 [Xenopus tropicalis]KAE8620694.1 hypothetical protein XENTR_v10010419 [Xenopus tropicalis]